jgi:LuxR family transcriptional regulator, quorum-sensing system regulator BjaR1
MRDPDMANLDSEVQLFISKLSQIGDTRVFAIAFEELVKKFDCKFFVISGIAEEGGAQQEMLVIHNLPEAWVSEYLENNYIINDPIARHCIEAQNPFLWREAIDATAALEAKNIMIRAEKYGLVNGVCFPIHNINGFEAGVSLSGFSTPPKKTEIRSLHLASIMAFNTVRRIRSDHSLSIHAISDREKEVLTWCALGKTSKEIAYILFVSENTVNVHIKNAISKLSAGNKTEAVAIAMRQGIINI